MSVLPPAKIAVGIVIERRKAQSPWIDFTWKPIAALPGQPDALPWTSIASTSCQPIVRVPFRLVIGS